MSDLIKRQMAIELIHSLYPSAPIMRGNRERWEKKYKPYIEAEKALEMLPSAKPEVIHCEDCRYRKYDVMFDQSWCGYLWGRQVVETDYCSMAERKCDGKNQSDL